jgi:import inner membrane translocase subunit TIM9
VISILLFKVLTEYIIFVFKIKEFIKQYNKIAELCFNDCINDFTTRKILNSEDACTTNCLEKYLKMNQRISMRFQEHQMLVNENQMVAAQKMGLFK